MELEPRSSRGQILPAAGPLETTASVTRAADQLVDALITREHVDVFFGLPGGAISPLEDSASRRSEARVITVRHESDAVFAAAGYARATGKVGVAFVTSGPGVLNAINALASAHVEGLPVLLIAGDAPRPLRSRGALQDGGVMGLDILHLARSVTKVATELVDPHAAVSQLVDMLATMKRGRRGAGLLSCPVDVLRTAASPTVHALPVEAEPMLDKNGLDRAAAFLARARRPVLYVGNGARNGDGPAALRALAERIQAPVITTPHAKGVFPESHPLSLGIYGMAMHPSAVEYLEGGFDCMLAVGTSFSELTTNAWNQNLRPRDAASTVIQIDVASDRIGRMFPVDLAIVGAAAPALRGIASRLTPAAPRTFGLRRKSSAEEQRLGPQGKLTPQHALWELQRAMPENTHFTVDGGEHTLYVLHYLAIDDPRAFTTALGTGSMGSGIGFAVGIAAAGTRPVSAIAGDGGFLMSTSAIATAAHAKLPIVYAIINDGRYGMCDIGYEAIYGKTPGFGTDGIDIAQVARGLGAQGIRITEPGQISALDLQAMRAAGTVVLDIHVDGDVRMFANARHETIQTRPDRGVYN